MTTKHNWLTDTPIAHRGLFDNACGIPENSVAAFKAAISHGLGIELDVRLSEDGVPVVIHDATLERMTGDTTPISALSAQRLKLKMLLNTPNTLPTLAQALGAVNGQVPVILELKTVGSHFNRELEKAVLAQLKTYTGHVAVVSFNPRTVTYMREHTATDVLVGQNLESTDHPWLFRLCLLKFALFGFKGDFLNVHMRDIAKKSIRALRDKYTVLTFTVRTAQQREKAIQHADNHMFDMFDGYPLPDAQTPKTKSKKKAA